MPPLAGPLSAALNYSLCSECRVHSEVLWFWLILASFFAS